MQIIKYAKIICSGLAVGLLISANTFGLEFTSLVQAFTYALAGGRTLAGIMDILLLVLPVFVAMVNIGGFFREEIDLNGVAIFSRYQNRSLWGAKQIAVLTLKTFVYELAILLGFILTESFVAHIPLQLENSLPALCIYLLLATINMERFILLSNIAALRFGTTGVYAVGAIDAIAVIGVTVVKESTPTILGYINPIYADLLARYDSALIGNFGVYAFDVIPAYTIGKSVFCMMLIIIAEIAILIHSVNTYELIERSK